MVSAKEEREIGEERWSVGAGCPGSLTQESAASPEGGEGRAHGYQAKGPAQCKDPEAGTQGSWAGWQGVEGESSEKSGLSVARAADHARPQDCCFFLLMRRRQIGDGFWVEGWCDVTHTVKNSSIFMSRIDWRKERREAKRTVGKFLH